MKNVGTKIICWLYYQNIGLYATNSQNDIGEWECYK